MVSLLDPRQNVSSFSSISGNISKLVRTELDSHAASAVVGNQVYILRETGKSIDVSPFTSTLGILKKVPVIDCLIAYECPFEGSVQILCIHNALHVPEMECNLLPPFIVRRNGHYVNEIRIQAKKPTVDHHCIFIEQINLRIPLQLHGTTSYFASRKPTDLEVEDAIADDQLIHLSKDEEEWDPHDLTFAQQEEYLLDFEGNIIEKEIRERRWNFQAGAVYLHKSTPFSDIDDDIALQVSSVLLYDEFQSNSEKIPLDIDTSDCVDKFASDVAAVTVLSLSK